MKNLNFVAIDFETATESRDSVCEVGIAVVEDSKVVETRSWLVRPFHNEYRRFNIDIHGITPDMTEDSPSFDDIWPELRPYLDHRTVVAHYTAFDMYVLRESLLFRGIPYPEFEFFCSYRVAKYVLTGEYSYSLGNLCDSLDIEYNERHRAGSDAAACAELFIRCLEESELPDFESFESKYECRRGFFGSPDFRPFRSVRKHSGEIDLKKIVGDPTKIDPDSYFYGKTVCFTGTCRYGARAGLLQKIADIGGIPANSVTKKTDILVVGQQDYRKVGEDGLSSKQEKAIAMKDSGHDIEIMSEAEFLQMI